MLEGTALDTGEDGGVDQLGHHLDLSLRSLQAPRILEVLADDDGTATGSAEGLVGGSGDDVGILDRVVQQAGSDKSCRVSHIHHKDSAYLVCDLTHPLPVPLTGISGSTADNQLGLVLEGSLLHLVVVHTAGLLVELVSYGMIVDTGHVDGRAVGKVSSVSQVETHEGVAGLEACHEYSHIRLCAGVRLNIGKLSTVKLFKTVDGQLLHLVYNLTAAIVAGSGITLGVLVGQARSECGQNVVADKVFRSDELNAMKLTALFLLNEFRYLKILFHNILLKLFISV